jgi:hypothetical protein
MVFLNDLETKDGEAVTADASSLKGKIVALYFSSRYIIYAMTLSLVSVEFSSHICYHFFVLVGALLANHSHRF